MPPIQSHEVDEIFRSLEDAELISAQYAQLKQEENNISISHYKPTELLGLLDGMFSQHRVNTQLISLQGIYMAGTGVAYNNVYYDTLRDETANSAITIIVDRGIRENLKSGNLVTLYGYICRKQNFGKGQIEIQFRVTRHEIIKQQVLTEDEQKRIEFRRIKEERGFKNVTNLLENKLLAGEKPKLALVYAETSIVNEDFANGILGARTNYDIHEERIPFTNVQGVVQLLARLDTQNYDAIALIRGGGSGLEALDNLLIAEKLAKLNTPWIFASAHKSDKVFIRNLADLDKAVPLDFGVYLRERVEKVEREKTQSQALLIQQVRAQVAKEIETKNNLIIEKDKQLVNKDKQLTEKDNQYQKQIQTKDQLIKNQERNIARLEVIERKYNGVSGKIERLEKANKKLIILIVISILAIIYAFVKGIIKI